MSATGTAATKKSATRSLDNPAALNLVQPKATAKVKASVVKVPAPEAAAILGKPSRVKPATKPEPVIPAKPVVPEGMKFCRRHNQTHPLADFASDRSSKDGRYSICRVAEAEDRAAKKAKAAGATLVSAVIANPAPVNAAISGLVADITKASKKAAKKATAKK